jgi:hypothetical protein
MHAQLLLAELIHRHCSLAAVRASRQTGRQVLPQQQRAQVREREVRYCQTDRTTLQA